MSNEHNLSGSGVLRGATRANAINRISKAQRNNQGGVGCIMWGVACITVFLLLAVLVVKQKPIVHGLPSVIQSVRGSVVHVMKVGECQGSGVALTKDIVMTARHVTDGDSSSSYIVTLDDGTKVDVVKIVEDKDNDISYLWVEDAVLDPAILAQANPSAGEMVLVFGSPLGFENFNTASPGYVTALGRDLYSQAGEQGKRYEWHQMIQSNAPSYPGNSGGPVFNMDGEVCGILVTVVDATLNWSVPVERFRFSLNSIKKLFIMDRFEVLVDDGVVEEQYYPSYNRTPEPRR